MPDWQERITRDTAPGIRVEHAARYRFAAPVIAQSEVWADLGCGNGTAAADGLGQRFAGRLMLVDIDENALRAATRELAVAHTTTLRADLALEADVGRLREQLDGPKGCVTCFETLEHLDSFGPLLGLLIELARDGFTVFVSVPNDAFQAVRNPYHRTTWGDSAITELRRLLPGEHLLARQYPLAGSCILTGDAPHRVDQCEVEVAPDRVASHYLAVLGPKAAGLHPVVGMDQVDSEEGRAWERQRDADVAFFQEAAEERDSIRRDLQANIKDMEEAREYIHELEGRLGLPLSGVEDDRDPPAGAS